jgi:hypothetical protein
MTSDPLLKVRQLLGLLSIRVTGQCHERTLALSLPAAKWEKVGRVVLAAVPSAKQGLRRRG